MHKRVRCLADRRRRVRGWRHRHYCIRWRTHLLLLLLLCMHIHTVSVLFPPKSRKRQQRVYYCLVAFAAPCNRPLYVPFASLLSLCPLCEWMWRSLLLLLLRVALLALCAVAVLLRMRSGSRRGFAPFGFMRACVCVLNIAHSLCVVSHSRLSHLLLTRLTGLNE